MVKSKSACGKRNYESVWYFAYGSNLSMTQMRSRVGEWKESKKALIRGWKLAFNVPSKTRGGGAANIVNTGNPNDMVYGAIYLVTAKQLQSLTVYEKVIPQARTVESEGEEVEAKTYIFKQDKPKLKPEREYLETIIKGLRDHNYPDNMIESVRREARAALKIIVFDMDGVLVDIDSSWQFVHRKLNVDNSDNLKQFLTHQISYLEFMKKDIELWGKANINTIKNILDEAPLMKNAKSTVAKLKKAGYKTAIISSGISILADRVQRELDIDFVFANRIVADRHGVLTGKGVEVVNPLNKEVVLRKFASEQHTTPRCCAVVGDTIFDVSMFREAGFSIAFNTDDKQVRKAANVAVEGRDLKRILPHLVL